MSAQTGVSARVRARHKRDRMREHLLARVFTGHMPGPPRPDPVPQPPATPAFPWRVHRFAPSSQRVPTQCGRCFGWYDDPRHYTPMERT